jgi:hypothetical protein
MKIKIEIETGNAAMLTGDDASDALFMLSESIRIEQAIDSGKVDGGKIMDVNGNSVGIWVVEN